MLFGKIVDSLHRFCKYTDDHGDRRIMGFLNEFSEFTSNNLSP